MPRYESEDLVRRHIWLYARDVERIELLFGRSLGFSKAARLMVRKFLDSVEAKGLLEAHHPVVPELSTTILQELEEYDRDGRSK